VQDADIAMYQAKAQGRDLHAVLTKMHVQALALLHWRMSYGGRAAGISGVSTDHLSLSNQQIIGFEASPLATS